MLLADVRVICGHCMYVVGSSLQQDLSPADLGSSKLRERRLVALSGGAELAQRIPLGPDRVEEGIEARPRAAARQYFSLK